MKYIQLFEEFSPKYKNVTVYRSGEEKGTMFDSKVTFYTTSKKGALTYGKHLKNPELIEKKISFNNPLVVVKNDKQLYDVLFDIFGKFIPSIYDFPFSLNDSHRETIIDYAINNGYDGIIMSDTDYDFKNVITSYIVIN
jgi:hypothetical protein